MAYLKFLLIGLSALCLCSCTIIKHMDELSSMGDFARDKADQQREVDRVKVNFDELLNAIHNNQMKFYPDQLSIRSKFGLPITIKMVEDEGHVLEQWLYRYAIMKEAKDRVYVYFDENKKVVKIQEEKIQWL